MVLLLHNRYRTTGGEERTVEDLVWLVREHLHEPAELLTRDSASLGRARAAVGLLRGGLQPGDVGRAVRLSGARIVHAHNLHPSLGWRALAAARRPAPGLCCTCTSTGSSARSASVTHAGQSARAVTDATRVPACG